MAPQQTGNFKHAKKALMLSALIIDEHIIHIGVHRRNLRRERHGQHRDAGLGIAAAQGPQYRGSQNDIADKGQVNNEYSVDRFRLCHWYHLFLIL